MCGAIGEESQGGSFGEGEEEDTVIK